MAAVKLDMAKEREDQARNRRERLEFVDLYVDWIRRTPNRVWSSQQGRMLDSVVRSLPRGRRDARVQSNRPERRGKRR